MNTTTLTHTTTVLTACAALFTAAFAGEDSRSAPATTASPAATPRAAAERPALFWDQVFGKKPQKKFHLYKNDANPWVQEVNATLRIQYQAAWVDGQPGNYPGSHNWTSGYRRFRAGWNARVLHDFKLQNVWNIGGVDNSTGTWDATRRQWQDHTQTSTSLYEAFVQYNYRQKGYTFAFGKTNPEIYAENRVSSSSLKVPEFSIPESTVCFDSVWGFWAANDTEKDKLGYYAGIWSTTNDGNKQIWGTWESCFTTLELSYGLDKVLLDKGRVYLDWVHSFADGEKTLARERDTFVGSTCEDVIAAYYIGRQGKFELTAEALVAMQSNVQDAGNMFGLVLLPSYRLTDRVEAVARFQYATGDRAVNVGKNRYVKALQSQSPGYADRYYAIGAGLNFYVYPQRPERLKVMTLIEYGNSSVDGASRAKNAGFTGWQFICGAYLNF